MRSALEGRWQGPRAASKGLPQARRPGSQLPSYRSHPPPVGIKRNVDNCNGPGKMTTERISNSCLKRWHLNHHTPLLNNTGQGEEASSLPQDWPSPQTRAVRRAGLNPQVERVKWEIYRTVFLSLKHQAVHMYTFLSTKT